MRLCVSVLQGHPSHQCQRTSGTELSPNSHQSSPNTPSHPHSSHTFTQTWGHDTKRHSAKLTVSHKLKLKIRNEKIWFFFLSCNDSAEAECERCCTWCTGQTWSCVSAWLYNWILNTKQDTFSHPKYIPLLHAFQHLKWRNLTNEETLLLSHWCPHHFLLHVYMTSLSLTSYTTVLCVWYLCMCM